MGIHFKFRADEVLSDNEVAWEISQAWDRVGGSGPTVKLEPPLLTEVMSWEEHEKLWGEHVSLQKLSPDCTKYFDLVQSLLCRDPTDQELDWLFEHENTCQTGMHSERMLEFELNLPEGAFRTGASEHELPSPNEFAEQIGREIYRSSTKKRLRLIKASP